MGTEVDTDIGTEVDMGTEVDIDIGTEVDRLR